MRSQKILQYRIVVILLIFGMIVFSVSCNRLSLARGEQDGRYEQFGLAKAKKLKSPISTRAGEFAPTISADGKTLVFQSNRGKGSPWLLYISHLTPSGWTIPEPIDSVNSPSFDGSPFLTYDQNYLLISSRRDGGEGEVDIWMARRVGTTWEPAVNLGKPVNTSSYDGYASLASDGKTLYFQRYASREEGCDLDYLNNVLMFSQKRSGQWTEPKPLPYPINTEYCETDPVILADGRTLLFSSNRPGGFGGFDIYKADRQSDGSWSDPVNLGNFINSSKHDWTATIPAAGDVMYFGKGTAETGDLYWLPIPDVIQPLPVVTVVGTVRDRATEEPLPAIITVINTVSGTDTTVVESNSIDGDYIVILLAGDTYDVSVSADGYTFYSTDYDLTGLSTYQSVERDIYLDRIEAGAQIVLNNVYFEFNKYRLLEKSHLELNRVIDLMNEYPDMIVEIAGHTDSIASEKYNLELSSKRAGAVVDYLTTHGVGQERLRPRGYGEAEPVADNGTEVGRSQNRRVEFRIISVSTAGQ